MKTMCFKQFFYKIPSEEILKSRKLFYDLKRKSGEQAKQWLDRVQNHIECCEFPKFVAYLLIDKFMCELAKDDKKFIRLANTWSLKQLNKYFGDEKVNKENIDETNDKYFDLNQEEFLLDSIKPEPQVHLF